MTTAETVQYHTQMLAKILLDFPTDTPSEFRNERNQEYVDAAKERLASAIQKHNDTVASPVMDSKMKTLIDGGRVIVGDLWMDEASRTDYGSEIRTCRNRHRCGIHDAYVAWIHESAKPTDLEFLPGYAIGSV